MKKFLSVILVAFMVCAILIIAGVAADDTYVSINNDCLVKSKVLDDESVFTYKTASGDCDGLLVGLPTNATVGNEYFQQKDNNHTIKYFDVKDRPITDSSAHIGTTDVIKVLDSNGNVVKKYGLVTYGDANGDGVFDVLDTSVAALCLNGFISCEKDPAVYESVKPRAEIDNETVETSDYQQMVNGSVSDILVGNTKGLKKIIDESLSFESVIYACDGNSKTASVTAGDSTFLKDCVKIYYNGSETAPSTPGIYSVTANVSEDDEFLVNAGERELGFIVIAPNNGIGYTTIVDNENKKITIDITKPNDTGADLTGYLNSWVNSAYSLTVDSKNVEDSKALSSALSLRNYDYYTTANDIITITAKSISDMSDTSTAALGCYLPDDYALWKDNTAEKSVPVSVSDEENSFSYSIVFRQNEELVNYLERSLNLWKYANIRGQRKICPTKSTGVDKTVLFFTTNYREAFAMGERRLLSETGAYENCIKTVVGAGKEHPTLKDALGGTGLKTALLGNNDTLSFVTASTKAALPEISADSQKLYDASFLRYSSLDSDDLKSDLLKLDEYNDLVNNVLSGFNMSVGLTTKTNTLTDKNSHGWCRYACADDNTGIRYTSDCYLEFKYVDATADAHRTLSLTKVSGCDIVVEIATIEGFSADKKAQLEGYTTRMAQYEPFRVSATLADGYKPSVKDVNGNDVPYDAEHGWYIMPAADVIVTAVPIS